MKKFRLQETLNLSTDADCITCAMRKKNLILILLVLNSSLHYLYPGEVTEATVAVAVWSAREAAVLQSEAADGLVADPAEVMEALTEATEAPVEDMEV